MEDLVCSQCTQKNTVIVMGKQGRVIDLASFFPTDEERLLHPSVLYTVDQPVQQSSVSFVERIQERTTTHLEEFDQWLTSAVLPHLNSDERVLITATREGWSVPLIQKFLGLTYYAVMRRRKRLFALLLFYKYYSDHQESLTRKFKSLLTQKQYRALLLLQSKRELASVSQKLRISQSTLSQRLKSVFRRLQYSRDEEIQDYIKHARKVLNKHFFQ